MQPWVQIWTSDQNQKFRDKFVRNWIEALPCIDGKTFLRGQNVTGVSKK